MEPPAPSSSSSSFDAPSPSSSTSSMRPKLAPLVVDRSTSGGVGGGSISSTASTPTHAFSNGGTPTTTTMTTEAVLPMPDLARVRTFIDNIPTTPLTPQSAATTPSGRNAAAAAATASGSGFFFSSPRVNPLVLEHAVVPSALPSPLAHHKSAAATAFTDAFASSTTSSQQQQHQHQHQQLHHARLPTTSSPFASTRSSSISEPFSFHHAHLHHGGTSSSAGPSALASRSSSLSATSSSSLSTSAPASPPCTCSIPHSQMSTPARSLSEDASAHSSSSLPTLRHSAAATATSTTAVDLNDEMYPIALHAEKPLHARSAPTETMSTSVDPMSPSPSVTPPPLYTLHVPADYSWNENTPHIYGGARQGGKPRQEDSFFSFVSPSRRIFVGGVFDGHGGVNGQVSSNIARIVSRVFLDLHQHAMDAWSADEWSSRLKRLFAEIHEQIRVQLAHGRTVASSSFQPIDAALFAVASNSASGDMVAASAAAAATATSDSFDRMDDGEGSSGSLAHGRGSFSATHSHSSTLSFSRSGSLSASLPSALCTSVCYASHHHHHHSSTSSSCASTSFASPTTPASQRLQQSPQQHSFDAAHVHARSSSAASAAASAVFSPSSTGTLPGSTTTNASRNYVDARGIVRDASHLPVHGGTTASVVVMILPPGVDDPTEATLISVNVGDSHVLLSNERNEWTFLTEDHGPDNPSEYARIQALPASQYPRKLQFVYDTVRSVRKSECPLVFLADGRKDPYYLEDPWRKGIHPTNMRFEPAVYAVSPRGVVADLTCIAMTRALGDFYAHQFGLTWEPSITVKTIRLQSQQSQQVQQVEQQQVQQQQQQLQQDDSSVLTARSFTICIASDGVWDCWTYQDVARTLNKAFAEAADASAHVAQVAQAAAPRSRSSSTSSSSSSTASPFSPSPLAVAPLLAPPAPAPTPHAGSTLLQRSVELGIQHFGATSFDDASLVLWRFSAVSTR